MAGTNPVNPLAVLDLDELAKKGKSLQDKVLEKYELLKEMMREIEGSNIPRSLDETEWSLVPGLVIPHKFKTPTFNKYDGTKCLTTHLIMYYRKMLAYTDNDKLLIYCFQDSLTGIAVQWYLKLDRTNILSLRLTGYLSRPWRKNITKASEITLRGGEPWPLKYSHP